jgi:hypothetical protein
MGLPMIVAHCHSTKGPRVALYCRALHRGLPAIPRIEIEFDDLCSLAAAESDDPGFWFGSSGRTARRPGVRRGADRRPDGRFRDQEHVLPSDTRWQFQRAG